MRQLLHLVDDEFTFNLRDTLSLLYILIENLDAFPLL